MRTLKQHQWKLSFILAAIFMWMMSMTVFASPDDNSLSALNVHNGTVSPEFSYSTWEYNVEVESGTTELYLDPSTSSETALITSITGTVLSEGKATVLINTQSESGIPMTYTLYVTEKGEGSQEETEETEEAETAAQTQEQTETVATEATEAQSEATEAITETEQTEKIASVNSNTDNALQAQVNKLKSNTDLMMKILYGFIAATVLLLFVIINLILKNKDLKDDLRDVQDRLTYQTNEFARKEKSMMTDTYYAPTQQGNTAEPVQPKEQPKPEVEKTEPEPVAENQKKEEDKDDHDDDDMNITMVEL